jgi:anti-anti-sigma regulatory factor
LIDTQSTCKKLNRGELVLAEVPPRIKEVLDLAGLTPLFKIFETETEAVGSF